MDNTKRHKDKYKETQAIPDDYKHSGYDKGHLNPNSYQEGIGKIATYTLTNAVPQDPCFNQQTWKVMEKGSKTIMDDKCAFRGAKRYFVTGVTPSKGKIPFREDVDHGKYERVTIPALMWTAACCDSSNAANESERNEGFSFAYYGTNFPDSVVNVFSLSKMGSELSSKYSVKNLSIFSDNCFENLSKSKDANENITDLARRTMRNSRRNRQEKHLGEIYSYFETWVEDEQNVPYFRALEGLADDVSVTLTSFSIQVPKLPEAQSYEKVAWVRVKRYLERQDNGDRVDAQREEDLCNDGYVLVPAISAKRTAYGDVCRYDHPCDYYDEKEFQWCYIDFNRIWGLCCTGECKPHNNMYQCESGNIIISCSPPYSRVTNPGIPCIEGHECGTHYQWYGGYNVFGNPYNWCYVDLRGNWHNCDNPP